MSQKRPVAGLGKALGLFMLMLLLYCIGASADDPIFSRFAAGFTSDAFLIGILASTGWITWTLMSGPAGGVVDKVGVKKTIFIGGTLDAVGFALIFLSNSIPMLVAVMILNGIGSAFFWAAARVHIANSSQGKTGRAFGMYSASWAIGWSFGPLMGGILAVAVGIRAPFLAAALIIMTITMVIVNLVPDDGNKTRMKKAVMYELKGGFFKDSLSFLTGAPRGVKRLLFIQMVEYAALEMVMVFSPLYFMQMNNAEIGILFFIQAIIFAAGSVMWGTLADRMITKHAFIVLGFIASGLVLFAFLNVSEFAIVAVLMGALGLALASVEPISQAMLNDRVRPKERGLANGLSAAAFGGGASAGPIVAGLAASYLGFAGIFIMAAVLCVVGGLTALTLGSARK
jgi:DHA1 family multidrug resistance protein-like MFS transporter